MGWALAVIVVLGIGVPIAAWSYTRLRPPPPPSSLGTAYDPIDKWLLRQHSLPPPDRDRVRTAVFDGRQVGDPDLAPAARELADSVLAGKLRRLRQGYAVAGIYVIMAACLGAIGIVSLVTGRGGGRTLGAALVLDSAMFTVATVMPRRETKKTLANVAAARQLNQDRS